LVEPENPVPVDQPFLNESEEKAEVIVQRKSLDSRDLGCDFLGVARHQNENHLRQWMQNSSLAVRSSAACSSVG
jgi:hypothetical protein